MFLLSFIRDFIKFFCSYGLAVTHSRNSTNRNVLRMLLKNNNTLYWLGSGMPLPAPQEVKFCFISQFSTSESTWIETGTYMGDMTEALARISKKVISIEPSEGLYRKSLERLSNFENVELIYGSSEASFEAACSSVRGSVMFWLDGHFSGGDTFKGAQDCPVEFELETISKFLFKYDQIHVYIDDFRLFRDTEMQTSDYPLKSFLAQWAEKNSLEWSVNNDIFCARTLV